MKNIFSVNLVAREQEFKALLSNIHILSGYLVVVVVFLNI